MPVAGLCSLALGSLQAGQESVNNLQALSDTGCNVPSRDGGWGYCEHGRGDRHLARHRHRGPERLRGGHLLLFGVLPLLQGGWRCIGEVRRSYLRVRVK